jgi:uncharacterized membrane protein YgcG
MSSATLIVHTPNQDSNEFDLSGDASIGRAFDNTICVRDAGASRYHAIIEKRADGYWLKDLGSINGTAVNGIAIKLDYKLQDGDSVSIGDQSRVEFRSYAGPVEEEVSASDPNGSTPAGGAVANESVSAGKPQSQPSPAKLIILAVAGFVVLAALAVLAIALISKSGRAAVRLASPQSGPVRGPVAVRVEAENTRTISRVVYQIDGIEFASAQASPYEVTIDPDQLVQNFPGLRSGNHVLSIVVESKDGKKEMQPGTALLSFKIGDRPSADGTNTVVSGPGGGGQDPGSGPSSGTFGGGTGAQGAVDVTNSAKVLAGTISGKDGWYIFDPEFVSRISSRTSDYRLEVTEDGRRYRRDISSAFSSKGVPMQIGFVIAVSESKFKIPPVTGADSEALIGFWRVPRKVADEQGYSKPTDNFASLNDPKHSAEIASAYAKDLLGLFGADDFMYAVSCWGMSLAQAGEIKGKLEKADPKAINRRDYWRMVRSGVVPSEGADHVVRFFAAGIVANNPRLFGLSGDPLSSLYN